MYAKRSCIRYNQHLAPISTDSQVLCMACSEGRTPPCDSCHQLKKGVAGVLFDDTRSAKDAMSSFFSLHSLFIYKVTRNGTRTAIGPMCYEANLRPAESFQIDRSSWASTDYLYTSNVGLGRQEEDVFTCSGEGSVVSSKKWMQKHFPNI